MLQGIKLTERKTEYISFRMDAQTEKRVLAVQQRLREEHGIAVTMSETIRYLIRLGLKAEGYDC